MCRSPWSHTAAHRETCRLLENGKKPVDPWSLTFSSLSSNTDNATFTASYGDPNDGRQILEGEFAFGPPPTAGYYASTANSCEVAYFPSANYDGNGDNLGGTLYLFSASSLWDARLWTTHVLVRDRQFWTDSVHGVCLVDAANTTYTVSGTTATLTVPVAFINRRPRRTPCSAPQTNASGSSDWANFGTTWTAPAVQLISSSLRQWRVARWNR